MIGNIYNIPRPFLLFLGETTDWRRIKTATGLAKWVPEDVVGQYSMLSRDCISAGTDVQFMNYDTAVKRGAKTLVVGLAPHGGSIPNSWRGTFKRAMEAGLHIASGMHERLRDDEDLVRFAETCGVQLFDFRHRDAPYPMGTGETRTGRRLLTVGHDSNCGKKYSSLSLSRYLKTLEVGFKHTFRSTGQTGFLISGSGINLDTVPADFMSGAVESLTPDTSPDHWDIIEGQASLTHPSYGCETLSLITGSQPDLMVMCVDVERTHYRNTKVPLADLAEEIQLVTMIARRSNPNAQMAGISLQCADNEWRSYRSYYEDHFNLDIFNPNIPTTFQPLVDKMARISTGKKENAQVTEAKADQ